MSRGFRPRERRVGWSLISQVVDSVAGTMAGGERDITVLLSELGLQRYTATFEDEEFTDPALLLSMRHDLRQPSLEELGMCVHATVRVGVSGGVGSSALPRCALQAAAPRRLASRAAWCRVRCAGIVFSGARSGTSTTVAKQASNRPRIATSRSRRPSAAPTGPLYFRDA